MIQHSPIIFVPCQKCQNYVALDYSNIFGCCHKCIPDGNTETLEMTVKWLISSLSGVESSITEGRINKKLITPDLFRLISGNLKMLQKKDERDCVNFRVVLANLLKSSSQKSKYAFPLNYIGSKKKLLPKIETILRKYSKNGDIFGDLFSGTGVVSGMASRLGIYSKIISNDIMYYGYVLAKAILCPPEIELVEPLKQKKRGFIYENYTTHAGRLYFSEENAELIDGIRTEIEKIQDENAKCVALASLLSSADKVANVASVYGAFLKKLKTSASKILDYKNLQQERVQINHVVHNTFAENIDEKMDVVYLDPPYNNRTYDSNYHILETIAKNDNPEIKGKTGLRTEEEKKSGFCGKHSAENCLKKLIENNSGSRIIILSYNSSGIISFSEIVKILSKNRGLDVYRIPYKEFTSHSEQEKTQIYEYLFVSFIPQSAVQFYDFL
jgi:adenine-specific DNA-methyltransferase